MSSLLQPEEIKKSPHLNTQSINKDTTFFIMYMVWFQLGIRNSDKQQFKNYVSEIVFFHSSSLQN